MSRGVVGVVLAMAVAAAVRGPAGAGDPAAWTPTAPRAPDEGDLARSLELWLTADSLQLDDGAAVPVWPDRSGRGRDVSATKGVRRDGVGMPGIFVRESGLFRRPAVRFDTATGYASSPDLPVPISGDAGLTILLVINLEPHDVGPPYDGILGLGDPAHPGDPGRPLAALVQVNRGEDHALHFAGGWNHDASLGAGSFRPLYGRPALVSIVKRPGPMRTTTRIFVDGREAVPPAGSLEGRDGIPDIRHRGDIGVYLGKAVGWAGSIRGDVGTALVYARPLDDAERAAVEAHLADAYGLVLAGQEADAAEFTAAERSHWAYQPVQDPPLPAVRDAAAAPTPLDRFVQAELEARSIVPAPAADRRTLLRRLSFDLTGLPPTPAEMEAFVADETAAAYEGVVERLLASPRYGEHWARHWLDAVRYAETTANDANAVMAQAWRYRDWCVDAFNRDLSYDRFLVEQLAGDLLPPTDSAAERTRRLVATGFFLIGPKALAETDKEQSRLDIVDDQIDVVGRAMLGLTLACARCHDHMFDAVRTRDYYALAGIFRGTEPFQDEARNASMWWEFPVPQGEGLEPVVVMAPQESAPRNLRVHLRGDRFTLGGIVPRGVPRIVGSLGTPGLDSAGAVRGAGSGRLELAEWITSAAHPLTSRVAVNRIWHHHFGRGLVPTPDNFGTRGEPPSHPALLDWLASRFVESGWSMKSLHRLIVHSAAYRRSTAAPPETMVADPDNRWLSHVRRRRLAAEEFRDALLAASGGLDLAPGGGEGAAAMLAKAEDIGAKIRPNRMATDDPFYTTSTKRSLYLPVIRNMLPDVLALFDAADPNGVTVVRGETTVASQALFLLNAPLVREQARVFAARLLADAVGDDERIDLAHRRCYGRPATEAEQREAVGFRDAYLAATADEPRPLAERELEAWQAWCQVLVCSNEFVYIE